jgi:hypothetical protein
VWRAFVCDGDGAAAGGRARFGYIFLPRGFAEMRGHVRWVVYFDLHLNLYETLYFERVIC